MLKVLKNLLPLPSPEVRGCLKELKKVARELHDPVFYELVHLQVVNMLQDKANEHAVRWRKMAHRDFVCLQVSNVARDLLLSGDHHKHRGILNHRGERLKHIYEYAVTELERSGFQSATETLHNVRQLSEQVRSLGHLSE